MIFYTLLILLTLTPSTTQTCLPQYDYMVNLYHKSQETAESSGQSKTKIHSFASTGLYWTGQSLDMNFRVGSKESGLVVQGADLYIMPRHRLLTLLPSTQRYKVTFSLYILRRAKSWKIREETFDTYKLDKMKEDYLTMSFGRTFKRSLLNLPRYRLTVSITSVIAGVHYKVTSLTAKQLLLHASCSTPFIVVRATRQDELAFLTNIMQRKKRRSPSPALYRYKDVTSLEVPSFKCQKRKFELQLADIGWDSWVIAPVKVDIGVCRGRCDDMNDLIPYAIAKHILNLKMPNREIGNICCQETSYTEIAALYVAEGQLVMSNLPQFVVSDCKCR